MKNKVIKALLSFFIVVTIFIIITIIFYYYRKNQIGDNWFEVDRAKDKYIVHYNGETYYQIDKNSIPIDVEDQDWVYTNEKLLQGPQISTGDYFCPDFLMPSVDVLNNEKVDGKYAYIATILVDTRRYYKISEN